MQIRSLITQTISAFKPIAKAESNPASTAPTPPASESVPTESAVLNSAPPPVVAGPSSQHWLAQSERTALGAMPAEGKMAELFHYNPGQAPLPEWKQDAMRGELRTLDELGYLKAGDPEMLQNCKPEGAFNLLSQGETIYYSTHPNTEAKPITSWNQLTEVAQAARLRVPH